MLAKVTPHSVAAGYINAVLWALAMIGVTLALWWVIRKLARSAWKR